MSIVFLSDLAELPDLPLGLSFSDEISPPQRFGVKVAEKDGRFIWEPATEADYRRSEAERLGIRPDEVKLSNCDTARPDFCNGTCEQEEGEVKTWCKAIYDRKERYSYCACRE